MSGASPQRVDVHNGEIRLAAERWAALSPDGGRPLGTVLLLHGGGQTRHSWRNTGTWLSEAGWNAISVDARGHGDSSWAPDGDYSLDALVCDLRAIVATLQELPVLVGASMGGMTALVAQGEHGDLARALVLVDIAPRVEPEGRERIRAFMADHVGGFDSLDEVAAAIRAYNPHRRRPPTPEGLKRTVRRGPDGRWYWHWDPAFLHKRDEPTRDERHERTRAAAAALTVPTLLVRGKSSDVVSDEGVAELRALVPHARFADVQQAGHMVAGDDNDVFTERLLDFLTEVAAGTAARTL